MHPAVVTASALRREDYLQLARALRRRNARAPLWAVAAVPLLLTGVFLFVASRVSGGWVTGLQMLSGWLAACTVVFVASTLLQPKRLWSAQRERLTAPGTVTFDDAGVGRDVPGVVAARVPWSRIAAVVDTGPAVGLQIGRYEWIMVALPADPALAARLRDVLHSHGPPL